MTNKQCSSLRAIAWQFPIIKLCSQFNEQASEHSFGDYFVSLVMTNNERHDELFTIFTTKTIMQRGGFIYLLTNKHNTTLYTGVTNNLQRRVFEHKTKLKPKSFTARYNLNKLVYYEGFHRIEEAIAREKQIKAGSRQKKIDLINSINAEWKDLYAEVLEF